MKKQPGFALLTVFLLLTAATFIVTQLYFKGRTYNTFIPVAVKRERAKLLARSGISIAIGQLALVDTEFVVEEKEDPKNKSEKSDLSNDPIKRAKRLLSFLLKTQHQWQTFEFEEKRDGLDGVLKICISCEEGKIPLKALIDSQKRIFKAPSQQSSLKMEDFFKTIFKKMSELSQEKDIYPLFEKYIKERRYDFIDGTDVCACEGFEVLKERIFYVPEPVREGQFKNNVYWSDLFTVWVETPTMNPLLFSSSVRRIFNLGVDTIGKPIPEDVSKKIIEKLDLQLSAWHTDWDTYLVPLYEKDYASLPKELSALLVAKFEPRVFSVLCYGTVGKIEQKLLAIITRTFDERGEVFEIKKLYWL